jgi:hypothetical protein
MSNWESRDSYIKNLENAKFPAEDLQWGNPTKLQALRSHIENVFKKGLEYEHKIEWKEENGQLKLIVISKDLGVLSVDIDLDQIRKNKIPRDFPEKLLLGFQDQFFKKTQRLVEKYGKKSPDSTGEFTSSP